MKKSVLFLGTLLVSALMTAAVWAADEVKVEIDGKALETDTPAQIIDGRTMVPMRAIFEAMGADIEWDAETKTITAVNDSHSISLEIGALNLVKDGQKVELSVPAQIIDGRTLVPARAVVESFDCPVVWIADTKTVKISTSTKGTADYDALDDNYSDWIEELSKGVERPAPASSKTVLDRALYSANADVKIVFAYLDLPGIIYGKEADFGECKNVKEAGKMLDKIWTSAFLDYYDFDKSKDDPDEYARLFVAAGLYFDDNLSYNFVKKDKDNYSLVYALADNVDGGAPLFGVILSDSEKGLRYYLFAPDDTGSAYSVISATDEDIREYELFMASDDGDFGEGLTKPKDFLKLVETIEAKNIPSRSLVDETQKKIDEIEGEKA